MEGFVRNWTGFAGRSIAENLWEQLQQLDPKASVIQPLNTCLRIEEG